MKIAVVPPDLDSLIPATQVAPAAAIEPLQAYADLKPSVDPSGIFERVYQQSEVDRIPTVLFRPDPSIPHSVQNGAQQLRVSVLFVVGTNGLATSVRVLKSSGSAEFDAIIAQSIRDDWSFTPAVKNKKKVRCMVQEAVTVKWSAGSPFSL